MVILYLNTIHQHPSHLCHGFSWKSFKHLDKIPCWWHIIPVYQLKVVVYQHSLYLSMVFFHFFPAFTFSCIPMNIWYISAHLLKLSAYRISSFLGEPAISKAASLCNVCLVIPHELWHRNPWVGQWQDTYHGSLNSVTGGVEPPQKKWNSHCWTDPCSHF